MRWINRVPEISHIEVINGFPFVKCVSGSEFFIGELVPIDLENPDSEDRLNRILSAIKDLQDGEVLRITQEREFSDLADSDSSRQEFLSRYLFSESRIQVSIEKNKHILSDLLTLKKSESLNPSILKEMGCRPLSREEIEKFFKFSGATVGSFIDTGEKVKGFIRFLKQGSRQINIFSLFSALQKLQGNFKIQITLKRPDPFIFKKTLNHLENEAKAAKIGDGGENAFQIEKLKAEARSQDEKPLSIEMILTLEAASEPELRGKLKEANAVLSDFMQTYIESCGAPRTFLCTFPGTAQHLTFLEFEGKIEGFLPIFTQGEPLKRGSRSALPLERVDGSIYQFDPILPGRINSNILVVGGSGVGKSALTNMISTALLNDKSFLMTKIDIGGSYRNECRMFQGTELSFDPRHPSGLNPFRLISSIRDHEDSASIISNFLRAVVIESREPYLPKSVAADLDMAVMKYLHSGEEHLSIDGFLNSGIEIPRASILRRFGKNAPYSNVFSGDADFSKTRYVYFNFENIANVTDRDFAQAIYAAATACIYIRSMVKGSYEKSGLRQAVFVDEARACIEYSYTTFSYLTANMRKFGDLTLFAAQSSNHLLGPGIDGPSRDIITNSSIKFLREIDSKEGEFQERFSLAGHEMDVLRAWREESLNKTHRKFLLKEGGVSKIVILRLTPEELFRVGTSPEEKMKIQGLVDHVGLTREEAIRCLAYH